MNNKTFYAIKEKSSDFLCRVNEYAYPDGDIDYMLEHVNYKYSDGYIFFNERLLDVEAVFNGRGNGTKTDPEIAVRAQSEYNKDNFEIVEVTMSFKVVK